MTTLNYITPTSEDDLAQYRRALSLAFASDLEGIKGWLEKAGHHNVRVLKDSSNAVRAGLLLVPMGQFFAGRSIPMLGVAGVAVPPEARAQGAALELMRAAVREARATNFPISTLYPATKSLYRKCGYEEAGLYYEASFDPRLLNIRVRNDDSLSIRAFTDDDRSAVRDLYASLAINADGFVDRGDYVWNRVESPRDGKATGFLFHSSTNTLEAYVFFLQKRLDSGKHQTTITDAAASTPAALRRVLSFLNDQRSMCEELIWRLPPASPFLTLLPEVSYRLTCKYEWMLRIADVKSALESRPFPSSISLSTTIHVDDDVIPENNRAFSLSISHTRAHVEPTSSPPVVRLHTRALAALYSGYASAESLALQSLAQAPPDTLAALTTAFSPTHRSLGLAPSMVDFF